MKRVGIIIPCFNEEDGIPALKPALKELHSTLATRGYATRWVFVDDGSTDNTPSLLLNLSQEIPNAVVKTHSTNQNLGAAIRTGISGCQECDYIAQLDSDLTYDPNILISLLEKLDAGSDLVTASPYHPLGLVVGVPIWRLTLSKTLSGIYRLLSGSTIHTFTAMVRAQRASTMALVASSRSDFTYFTEVLLNSLRIGLNVEEVPATLRVRKFGASKMRVVRTILCHIGLIAQFCFKGSSK